MSACSCPAGDSPSLHPMRSPFPPPLPTLRAGDGLQSTHLMHLIHSSFSSGVGAEMRYTVWLPSTTRPSASVLHALITWSLLSGM